MAEVFLNRITTAVPPHDVHAAFIEFAREQLISAGGNLALFDRMASRSGIEHRYSCLSPAVAATGAASAHEFYARGQFPGTAARMRMFAEQAPALAASAVQRVAQQRELGRISHLLVTCCTGLSAPGLDFEVIARCGLSPSVERTMVGFMGCYAAINALKLARHIVRSERSASVLIVNIELCTLHLHEASDLEQILAFLLFADGCAASVVSAAPEGFRLDSFQAVKIPDTQDLITWDVGDSGFDMVLSSKVPKALREAMPIAAGEILDGSSARDIALWAVHPGGRSILDAVEQGLKLPPAALDVSRAVLRRYGNMSSATVMFVLAEMLANCPPRAPGCAMAFGPGVVAETMLFSAAAGARRSFGRNTAIPAETV